MSTAAECCLSSNVIAHASVETRLCSACTTNAGFWNLSAHALSKIRLLRQHTADCVQHAPLTQQFGDRLTCSTPLMLMLSRTSGVIATRIHQYGVAACSTSDCRSSSAVMGYLSPANALLAKAPPANPLHNTVVFMSRQLSCIFFTTWKS